VLLLFTPYTVSGERVYGQKLEAVYPRFFFMSGTTCILSGVPWSNICFLCPFWLLPSGGGVSCSQCCAAVIDLGAILHAAQYWNLRHGLAWRGLDTTDENILWHPALHYITLQYCTVHIKSPILCLFVFQSGTATISRYIQF
jgi:hypothetical protein